MTRKLTVREAKNRFEDELMSINGVTGVEEGEENGKPCVIVYVREAKPSITMAIPKVIEGFPVEIKETTEFMTLDSK